MLVDCPECKKKISDQATSCPHCGYMLRNTNIEERPGYTPMPHNEGCFLQTMNVGCLAVVAILLCLWLSHATGSPELSFFILIGIAIIWIFNQKNSRK